MKAIVSTLDGPVLKSVPNPLLKSDTDVLVEVTAVAICRTDLYAAEGRINVAENLILGHEFTGLVLDCGDRVEKFRTGDLIVANPSFACGKCEMCLAETPHFCAHDQFLGLDRDGAFAEAIVVPEEFLYHLNPAISMRVGTFFEPIAAGLSVLSSDALTNHIDCSKVSVAILGSNRIGRLTKELIAERFENISIHNDFDEVDQFDVIIETENLSDCITGIIRALKPRGTLLVKSREPADLKLPILATIQKQIKIEACRYGPFDLALDYLANHSEKLDSYLDEGWSLDQFEAAFVKAKSTEQQKVWFNLRQSQ